MWIVIHRMKGSSNENMVSLKLVYSYIMVAVSLIALS